VNDKVINVSSWNIEKLIDKTIDKRLTRNTLRSNLAETAATASQEQISRQKGTLSVSSWKKKRNQSGRFCLGAESPAPKTEGSCTKKSESI